MVDVTVFANKNIFRIVDFGGWLNPCPLAKRAEFLGGCTVGFVVKFQKSEEPTPGGYTEYDSKNLRDHLAFPLLNFPCMKSLFAAI